MTTGRMATPAPGTENPVGFIGLGMMGSAMAEMLCADGHRLVVWNREPELLAPFAARGVAVAASPADVAASCDVVMVCVLDTEAVREVVLGRYGVVVNGGADKILVDHSTAIPNETEAMATELRARTGMAWIDAPVSGGPGFARERRLTVMAGGPEDAIERVRRLLVSYAGNVTRVGETGAGQMAKVINQAISGVSYVLMAEALRLAEASGIDPARIPDCLAGGHADSAMLRFAYPKMLARAFDPPASFASQMLKDLKNVEQEAERLALHLPLVATARERFSRYVEAGNAKRETASIYNLYQSGA
ncbi:MAG: NAD(P)-dependent oxidoreductase [Hyphomicrobiales bacterium]